MNESHPSKNQFELVEAGFLIEKQETEAPQNIIAQILIEQSLTFLVF